jgi:hypothetical protein
MSTDELPDVRPPNYPWLPLRHGSPNVAVITYYCGDAKSLVVPIRDITNRNDAKHDPNVETMTYGLFSHCCKDARTAIVKRGITTHFFVTPRSSGRVLAGYYRPSWYCEMEPNDFAIAADLIRFISPGYALRNLVDFIQDYPIDKFFYTWKIIENADVIRKLLLLLNSAPDATATHIAEIHNKEVYCMQQFGRMYYDRLAGFSWQYAAQLMRKYGLI